MSRPFRSLSRWDSTRKYCGALAGVMLWALAGWAQQARSSAGRSPSQARRVTDAIGGVGLGAAHAGPVGGVDGDAVRGARRLRTHLVVGAIEERDLGIHVADLLGDRLPGGVEGLDQEAHAGIAKAPVVIDVAPDAGPIAPVRAVLGLDAEVLV